MEGDLRNKSLIEELEKAIDDREKVINKKKKEVAFLEKEISSFRVSLKLLKTADNQEDGKPHTQNKQATLLDLIREKSDGYTMNELYNITGYGKHYISCTLSRLKRLGELRKDEDTKKYSF